MPPYAPTRCGKAAGNVWRRCNVATLKLCRRRSERAAFSLSEHHLAAERRTPEQGTAIASGPPRGIPVAPGNLTRPYSVPAPRDAEQSPDLSIIAPLYNEAENVPLLVEWLVGAVTVYGGTAEVILVDDGSTDETWDRIETAAAANPLIHGVRLRKNAGQTAAMMAGFDHAQGRIIVSLDGDLQNDPRDIPALVAKMDEGYDLVCGWRQQRQDAVILRKIPSWIANRLIRGLTGVPIRDNGCSLKAYRRELLDRLNLYADQHRFIPALSASWGARIAEIPVRHHARRFGKSKYGISRTVKVLADLVTLKMITSFRQRPMVGFALAALPALLAAWMFSAMWVIAMTRFGPDKADALVFPGAALLWFAAALYLCMLGLVAEVAVRHDLVESSLGPVAQEL